MMHLSPGGNIFHHCNSSSRHDPLYTTDTTDSSLECSGSGAGFKNDQWLALMDANKANVMKRVMEKERRRQAIKQAQQQNSCNNTKFISASHQHHHNSPRPTWAGNSGQNGYSRHSPPPVVVVNFSATTSYSWRKRSRDADDDEKKEEDECSTATRSASSAPAAAPSAATYHASTLIKHEAEVAQVTRQAEKSHFSEAVSRASAEFARGSGRPYGMPNPVAITGLSCILFEAGLKRLGYTTIRDLLDQPSHYQFGFHGTPKVEAISGIFKDGLDVSRRRVQAFGAGEYFDIGNGSVAEHHNGTTGCLIVVLIVTKDRSGCPIPEYKTSPFGETTIAVVNNPMLQKPSDSSSRSRNRSGLAQALKATTATVTTSSSSSPPTEAGNYSFCLPCAIASKSPIENEVKQHLLSALSDGRSAMRHCSPMPRQRQLSPPPCPFAATATTTPSGHSRPRLLCYQDLDSHTEWNPLPDDMQEKARRISTGGSGGTGVQTTEFRGDAGVYSYHINLGTMTQTNLTSGRTRALKWIPEVHLHGTRCGNEKQQQK